MQKYLVIPKAYLVLLGNIKGTSGSSHFIFEINVGREWIRRTTTLKLNNQFLDRLKNSNRLKIQIQSRSMSDPFSSDIDFKDKMAWV